MKTNRLLAIITVLGISAITAFADSPGSIDVVASTELANGGSFRIRYEDYDSHEIVTNVAHTHATFVNIKKGSPFTIDRIETSVNGCIFAGTSPITDVIPTNGKTVTETLVYNVPTGPAFVGTAPTLSIAKKPQGYMQLSISGPPGQTVDVEATTSLCPANWTKLSTTVLDLSGAGSFMDTDAGQYSMRFYRLKVTQ
jgi:hypothetical protein